MTLALADRARSNGNRPCRRAWSAAQAAPAAIEQIASIPIYYQVNIIAFSMAVARRCGGPLPF